MKRILLIAFVGMMLGLLSGCAEKSKCPCHRECPCAAKTAKEAPPAK
jgi:hypothetical protein